MRTPRLLATLFACALAGLPIASCSGMGEGERCDYNEDCASNLECIAAGELSWPSGKTDRGICCPVGGADARKKSTAEVCRSSSVAVIPDSGTPDTGTPMVDSGSDAGSDGSDGAATDASDASSDGPADGSNGG